MRAIRDGKCSRRHSLDTKPFAAAVKKIAQMATSDTVPGPDKSEVSPKSGEDHLEAARRLSTIPRQHEQPQRGREIVPRSLFSSTSEMS